MLNRVERLIRILLRLEKLFPFGGVQAFLILMFTFCGYFVINTALVECSRSSTCGNDAFKSSVWGEPTDDVIYCELDNADDLLRERRNALSSIAYMYFGTVILLFGIFDIDYLTRHKKENRKCFASHVTLSPSMSILFGVSLVYLGLGNFFHHAHGSRSAISHDRAASFFQTTIVITFNSLILLDPEFENANLLKYLVLCFGSIVGLVLTGLTLGNVFSNEASNAVLLAMVALAVMLLIFSVLVRKVIRRILSWQCVRYLVLVSIFFLIAALLEEEIVPIGCNEEAFLQAHSVWHVFSSLSMFFLYLFYRADGVAPLVDKIENSDMQ